MLSTKAATLLRGKIFLDQWIDSSRVRVNSRKENWLKSVLQIVLNL